MPELTGKFLRYLMTGGTAAVVDVGGFALLLRTGLPVPAAGAASFCAAAVVNYLLTSRFVFRRAAHPRGFAVFLGAAGLGLLINVGVTWAAAAQLPIPAVLAKLMGVGVAFAANFLLNAFVVFSARVHGATDGGASGALSQPLCSAAKVPAWPTPPCPNPSRRRSGRLPSGCAPTA